MSIRLLTTSNYENNIFSNPLPQDPVLLINSAVFHISTLGIPLALYKVASCVFKKKEAEIFQQEAIKSMRKYMELQSPVGEKAFLFAIEKLQENPGIISAIFFKRNDKGSKLHQPIIPAIALLKTLYSDKILKEFELSLKENEKDSWSNKNVIKAADACIKIAYVISVLTLCDLKLFTKNLALKKINRTYAEVLTKQDSYLYFTFYACPTVYHKLRVGMICSPNPQKKKQLVLPKNISLDHTKLFYEKLTIQYSWRDLYNNYCDQIREYVNEKDLFEADPRHVAWSQKDLESDKFKPFPDTQPT